MFLSCGDALFDLLAVPGDDAAGVRLEGHVGGSPLNVAVGLARLGNPTGYLCKNSDDLFGERIRAYLDANGVALDWVLPTARNSTLAIVQTDAAGAASYVFHIAGTADVSIREEELPASLPDALGVVHVGSYSSVVEPTAGALLALVRRESARRLISYDPNVRLSIQPDTHVWRDRFAELAGVADVVKASDEDVAALGGGARDRDAFDAFAADAIGRGVRVVLVTRGGDGAVAYAADGRVSEVPGVPVTVRDTVGAGDTFQAATLHALAAGGAIDGGTLRLERVDLDALAGFATAAAAITCTRDGANLPTLAELERFRAERAGG